MKDVAKTLRQYLWGIINAIIPRANNSLAESINSRIKMVKAKARGFRNMGRFRDAIYFHHGGLDMLPAGVEL